MPRKLLQKIYKGSVNMPTYEGLRLKILKIRRKSFANYRKKIYGEREQFISDLERICIFLTSDNDKDYEGDDK